jgi:phosphoglycerate dehydrogenase-like enzyme
MLGKIFITPRSLTKTRHPQVQRLADAGYDIVLAPAGQQPTEEQMLRCVPDCVGWLAGVEPIGNRVLEATNTLKVISRNGTGVDNIDLSAATRCGIAVLRADGANAQGVAELAITLTLALARSVPLSDHAIKSGRWERRIGMEINGRTLGLVGCGRIGQIVAQLAIGLGMNVIAFDLFPNPSFSPSPQFRYASMDEVFSQSDVISLHAPASRDGTPLVNRATLAQMRRGALLVNTARASLIDANALLAALNEGQVAGAAIDVFDVEPPIDRTLAEHERVVATPHVGAFTKESVDRAVEVAVDNLIGFLTC